MGDYWRVNSYGYPNPFSSDSKHLQAWETLLTFFEHSEYSELKNYWNSARAPRPLSSHAVESWKATFEEFGLLHVPASSNRIAITPAGQQFKSAAEADKESEWAWIGLNLVLRYPLRGPRRSRRGGQGESDLLPYWFLLAALRELNNYIWFPELERVLGSVMFRADASTAVQTVRRLRGRELEIESIPLPVTERSGQFYNSLNQVPNHASLGYTLIDKTTDVAHYDQPLGSRRHELVARWIPLVDLALGGSAQRPGDANCGGNDSFIERMPAAPAFGADEEAYFQYLGARVDPFTSLETGAGARLREMPFGQGTVVVLRPGMDYAVQAEHLIIGPIGRVCRLVKEQRVILGHDLTCTYKVVDKRRLPNGEIAINVRKARPITDSVPIEEFLREKHD